jgi:hypothetical protein
VLYEACVKYVNQTGHYGLSVGKYLLTLMIKYASSETSVDLQQLTLRYIQEYLPLYVCL